MAHRAWRFCRSVAFWRERDKRSCVTHSILYDCATPTERVQFRLITNYKQPVGSQEPWEDDSDIDVVVEKAKPKLKKPPMYQVVMLNDDYTRMEFVVEVLMKFFSMDAETANRIMLTVHIFGQAVVGIFPKEIAEAKSEQVNNYSYQRNYPLHTIIEMSD